MDNKISFEEARLHKDIFGLYKRGLDKLRDSHTRRIEEAVIRKAAYNTIKILKENNMSLSFYELSNQHEFFEILFEQMCNAIILTSPLAVNSSDKFRSDLKAYLYDCREIDLNRLYFDQDVYDTKPAISDYEFDILSMRNSVESFANRKMMYGTKK